MTRTKKALFGLITATMVLLLLEGFLSFVSALRTGSTVEGMREEVHTEYDPELGWTNLPGYVSDRTVPFAVTINSQGLRATRAFASHPWSRSTRWVSGWSATFSRMVPNMRVVR